MLRLSIHHAIPRSGPGLEGRRARPGTSHGVTKRLSSPVAASIRLARSTSQGLGQIRPVPGEEFGAAHPEVCAVALRHVEHPPGELAAHPGGWLGKAHPGGVRPRSCRFDAGVSFRRLAPYGMPIPSPIDENAWFVPSNRLLSHRRLRPSESMLWVEHPLHVYVILLTMDSQSSNLSNPYLFFAKLQARWVIQTLSSS